jgi:ABC-type dipeptide/oligopeptide/nickel transport system ATPase component
MAKVVLENVFKIYPGNVTAVHDANLTIEDQEFVVLVGPSGCGKSTTLRMVAGLEEITKGSIYIDGKKVNEVPPKDRDIAMVFQNYALYPHMSVYKNMAFGLKLRRYPKPEIDAAVREAAGHPRHPAAAWSANPRSCPAASASAWPWAARSCANPRRSCSTSRSPTSTPRCACRCAPRSASCTPAVLHHDLRDPRPGGGHDHGRPHRGHEGRLHPAGRRAARTLRPARPTSSSPASSAVRP